MHNRIKLTLQPNNYEKLCFQTLKTNKYLSVRLIIYYLLKKTLCFFFLWQEIPQKLVKRVTNSLEVAVNIDQDTLEKKEQKPNRLIEILKAMFIPSESPLQTKRTDFLIRARKIGFKMIPQLLFPALPKLARDIWVFGEFFITLFQFLFALISTNYRTSVNRLFTGIYLTLSTINFILACIDAFLYFYELGSCRSIFESLKEMRNKKQKATANEIALEELQQEEIVELENKKVYYKWIRLSEKRKQQLNIWFELIRTILSELLIYPLIIFDLFDAVGIGFVDDKQNLSLFVIGSFYLVLAVYIARVAMSIMTLLTLRRLLLHSKTSPSNIRFILRFLIHIITQVIVHISCVIAVGIKIRQENSGDGESYNASPILWAVMIGGWVIPFLGVVSFFIVNYYWMQQFATGIYVEMISLLQTPSVAESLFQSKSEMSQETEERSKQFLEKMQHKKVQEEYENEVDTTSRFSKLIHPLKVPGFIFLCILYNLFLGTFLACLLLTYDNGNVSVVSLDEFEGIALVVLIIIITIANIHIMFLTIFSFVLIIIVFIIIALLPGMCAIPLFHALSIVVKKLRQSNEPSHNSEITSHE